MDILLTVEEIDVLELNYDRGICQLEKLIPAWRKIQQTKPCLAFADITLAEVAHILDELSPVGLSLQTIAPTMEDAVAKRDLVYQRGNSPGQGAINPVQTTE